MEPTLVAKAHAPRLWWIALPAVTAIAIGLLVAALAAMGNLFTAWWQPVLACAAFTALSTLRLLSYGKCSVAIRGDRLIAAFLGSHPAAIRLGSGTRVVRYVSPAGTDLLIGGDGLAVLLSDAVFADADLAALTRAAQEAGASVEVEQRRRTLTELKEDWGEVAEMPDHWGAFLSQFVMMRVYRAE